MAKLGADQAKAVSEAESTGGLIEDGAYEFFLKDVDEKSGEKGPYWSWVFKVPEDAAVYAGRQMWLNTSLSKEAAWRLKEVFEAFNVPTDTDTDDLIGKRIILVIGTETAQAGKMKGQLVNVITKLLPVDPAAVTTSSGKVSTSEAPLY